MPLRLCSVLQCRTSPSLVAFFELFSVWWAWSCGIPGLGPFLSGNDLAAIPVMARMLHCGLCGIPVSFYA